MKGESTAEAKEAAKAETKAAAKAETKAAAKAAAKAATKAAAKAAAKIGVQRAHKISRWISLCTKNLTLDFIVHSRWVLCTHTGFFCEHKIKKQGFHKCQRALYIGIPGSGSRADPISLDCE